jgi:tetratricopeptide (TPR) repeat protein
MNKCPFITYKQLVKEVRYDADGKVTEEKEFPSAELRECLGAECEIYDTEVGRCSLPAIDRKLPKSDESREEESKAGNILSEVKEIKENTAATLLHILKKLDAVNETLSKTSQNTAAPSAPGEPAAAGPGLEEIKQQLIAANEKLAGLPAADLSKVQEMIGALTEEIKISQGKFSDILELTLEEQQKRASQEAQQAQDGSRLAEKLDAIKEALAGRQDNPRLEEHLAAIRESLSAPKPDAGKNEEHLAAIKEALVNSQEKSSSILELMLEDTQKHAEQNEKTLQSLADLVKGQQEMRDQLVAALGKAGSGQSEELGNKLAQIQESMLGLLEAQRNEQRMAVNEKRRQQADEHNEKGSLLYYRRELAGAEAEFKKALDIRPDFYEAYNNMGMALSDQGRREEAVAAFRKAIELSPDSPEAYNNLGCLFKVKKDYQQAVELFNQALAKQADYSLAYLNLGTAYEEMEKFDLAIKSWEKVLSLQPTNDEARRKIAIYRAKRT